MSLVLQRLADALDRERRSALAADLDALLALQEEKRALIDEAKRDPSVEGAALAQPSERSRANPLLLWQLVAIQRGLAGESASYGADGRERSATMPAPRGAL